MNKETIELRRDKNCPNGYSQYNYLSSDSEEVLETILNWSKLNLNVKIYKHKVRFVYENDNGQLYDWRNWPPSNNRPNTTTCDFVYYLDIYYQ